MRYLTDIDMCQNELKNVVLHPSKEAPKNPKIGQFYTDISGSSPKLMWYDGSKWSPVGASVPEKTPTKVEPSVSIEIDAIDTSSTEVGTTIPISFTAKFNPGSYSYGPATGVVVESWKVYDTEEPANISTDPVGTFTDVTVSDDTEYKITVEAKHSAGVVPVTDQGSEYPAAQIQAGVKSASTKSIAGYRKYFYGTTNSVIELTSGNIRGLTHSTAPIGEGVSFDMPITKGANQVIIAFPSNAGLSLSSVIDTGAFNIEVYDIFSKNTVPVEGANGYDAIDYDVYVYTPDLSLNKNTYKVTISK